MRLCYISAGAFSHVGAYLEHFHRAGHEVHFVALSPTPQRPVVTHAVGLGGGKWQYPFSMLRARALVRELKPDVVHTHFATSGGLAGLACGLHPTIVTAHGSDLTKGVRSPVWRPLLKAVFDHADVVNTVSDDLRSMALSLGVPPLKVRTLNVGVDTRSFSFAPRPLGRPLRLLCTRRLDPECGPATVLDAAFLLRRSGLDFTLTFAGDGRLRRELERRSGGLARFLGAVESHRLPGLLAEHDVYLSASLRDGTSLSLLEAMASGLFPVVSRIPANLAWLEHGRTALLHEPADAADLAAKVLELARRPELAARAGPLNRAKVEAAGDRETNMRSLEALYKTLA